MSGRSNTGFAGGWPVHDLSVGLIPEPVLVHPSAGSPRLRGPLEPRDATPPRPDRPQEKEPERVAAAEPASEPAPVDREDHGDESRPVKRKKGPTALEVLAGVQKGMMIGQGAASAARSGMDAAGTLGDNLTAIDEGRYEDVESMDYQVSVEIFSGS